MKDIAIFFTEPAFDAEPFDSPLYRSAYYKLARTIARKGGRTFITRHRDTYREGNMFSGGWMFDGEEFRRVEIPFTVDLIFNKGRCTFTDAARVINDPELDELCTNKAKTYELFARLSPLTVAVSDRQGLERALERMSSDTIVAKPLDGDSGKGVIVGSRDEIRSRVAAFPYLIQEFIDTSGGIPGITDTKHDFRITSIQGTIVLSLLRTPKEGSYLANASQGGTLREIPIREIPSEPLRIFREVDAVLSRFPDRIYSLDVGRNRDGTWKIIELNSQPGLLIHDLKEDGKHFTDTLADFLLQDRA